MRTQKRYREAGTCYWNRAQQLGRHDKLLLAQKWKKGQLLHNAALSFVLAAEQQKRPEVSLHLLEKAVLLWRQIRTERLCQTLAHCERLAQLESRHHQRIGYTALPIVVGSTPARISLRGYRYHKQHQGKSWSPRVRPGRYTLQVRYPQGPPLVRQVKVTAHVVRVQLFSPPSSRPRTRPRKPTSSRPAGKPPVSRATRHHKTQAPAPRSSSLPVLSWLGYIGGGVTLAGGSILLGSGAGAWLAAEQQWTDPTTVQSPGFKQQLESQRESALPQIYAGWALLATGTLLTAVGVGVHLFWRSRRPPPSLPSTASSHHTLWSPSPSPNVETDP